MVRQHVDACIARRSARMAACEDDVALQSEATLNTAGGNFGGKSSNSG